MSNSSQEPWSDDPNPPNISFPLYFAEKANIAGILIGGIFYGIAIVLFFRCMSALCNPVNYAKAGIKWGLVAYIAAMFSIVTIFTATNLSIQSGSYIDNREFPGIDGVLPPGPLGYQFLIYSRGVSIVRNLTFLLNNRLADGLLLYRCHVVYSMNYWLIALPCLMYIASLATGVTFVHRASQPDSSIWNSVAISLGLPYFSISISLNVLLTLMIIAKLIMHNISIGKILGPPARTSGFYRTTEAIVIMLVESSALYAINSLLFVIPWGAESHVADIFLPILAETQVIAPFLIIQRVASQSALTNTIYSSKASQFVVRGRGESTRDTMAGLPDGYPTSSMDPSGKTPDEPRVAVGTAIYTSIATSSEWSLKT